MGLLFFLSGGWFGLSWPASPARAFVVHLRRTIRVSDASGWARQPFVSFKRRLNIHQYIRGRILDEKMKERITDNCIGPGVCTYPKNGWSMYEKKK